MSRFVTTLVTYIRNQFVSAIAGTVNDPDDQDLRLSFSGPPMGMLGDVFEGLLDGKSKIVFDEIPTPVDALVFLVDENATCGQEDVGKSCRCTSENLNSIRNQNVHQFIYLHEIGESISASLLTAKVAAGLKQKPSSFEQWYSDPLIQFLADAALARFKMNADKGCQDALRHCLSELWAHDDSTQDKPETWRLFRRVFDEPVENETNYQCLLAVLGLVNCEKKQIGKNSHVEVLSKIGGLFENNSIPSTFNDFNSTADTDLIPHIDGLRNHLSDCVLPSHFSSAPILKYRPLDNGQIAVPEWWSTLTLDVWNDVLGGNTPSTTNDLEVGFEKELIKTQQGIPCLFEDKAHFVLRFKDGCPARKVQVHRASGSKALQQVAELEVSSEDVCYWEDNDVPDHAKYVRYRFEADGIKPVNLKIISLEKYELGVVATSSSAKKVTSFKPIKKKKKEFECDFRLNGIGSHRIDIYTSSKVVLADKIRCIDNSSELEGTELRVITPNDANSSCCVVDADEECVFEFRAELDGDEVVFQINATADDHTPTGASSVFEQLVIEHIRKQATRVDPRLSRLTDLQSWIAGEPSDSFHPVGLGPDFLDAWHKPAWKEHELLSKKKLLLPPWPAPEDFKIPCEFLDTRAQVIEQICSASDSGTFSQIEAIRLHELMVNPDFQKLLHDFLSSYSNWLQSDFLSASWCDVFTLHAEEQATGSLERTPYAIMLSPFHPVRLGWQFLAQELLFRDAKQRCPAASTFDPNTNPDCMLLPCRTPSNDFKNVPFVAVPNSSDYWHVLWSTNAIDRLKSSLSNPFFDGEFGIEVEGLTSGFSAQQVNQTLNEVSKILAARSSLSISIKSDTKGKSNCNDGIEEWCLQNLGTESDAWLDAGANTLRVYDYRDESLHPEQAALASLTAQTQTTVTWFAGAEGQRTDLSVIDHLGSASPEFQELNLRSFVDKSGLLRCRMRKQLSNQNRFVAESRVGKPPRIIDPSSIRSLLIQCVDNIESRCAQEFDSFAFAPNLSTLWDGLKKAQFAAVTSSNIDVACFFGTDQDAFLWDYELPRYAARAGDNSGYFLLASQSESMFNAVRSAIASLSIKEKLENEDIQKLLIEVSRRGIPTLKRLTGGGSISLGEVGVLAGFKLMQSDFDLDAAEAAGLISAFDKDDGSVNLIIPVDSFQNHFEDLHRAIDSKRGQRPDLLVFSILQVKGEAKVVRITPVEIKARSGASPMGKKERGEALQQATSFAEFLSRIKQLSNEYELWGIAWRGLIATMLQYGFRVYGQLDKFINNSEWEKLQASTLEQLASGVLETQLDTDGRLILIDEQQSTLMDESNSGLHKTVVLSHKDAFKVLTGNAGSLLEVIKEKIGDWELKPKLDPDAKPIPKSPPDVKPGLEIVDEPEQDAKVVVDGAKGPQVGDPKKEKKLDCDASGIKFRIGATIDGFENRDVEFFPGNTALNQLNVGIVGDLGTGKTQLIKSIVYQTVNNPESNQGVKPNILIFDYKKDYSKPDFVNATGARVIEPYQIPLNIFDTRDCPIQRNAWLEKSRFFTDVLAKIYSGIGPAQSFNIKQAVKAAFESNLDSPGHDPTLKDVMRCYRDIIGDKVDSPFSIMSDLVDGDYFTSDKSKILPFKEFLDGVVVIDLSAVGQDDKTKNMLVVVFLNMFYDHMLRIKKRDFWGSDPQRRVIDSLLLVDEADNIMQYEFDVLKKILLQGREFGVGVLLASQYLSHFKTSHENYLEPLLTWFVHKIPNVTTRELTGIGLTNASGETVDKIKSLEVFECLLKTLGVDGEFVRAVPLYKLLEND
jgi:DNA phosphorothioation-dependent restriction protein DptH